MKRTHVVATLLWAGAWVLLGASPASASGETVGSCMVETIESLGGPEAVEATIEAGHESGAGEEATVALEDLEGEFEGCLEAPNMIIPELNEIIWGGLAFFVLLGAMIKWGFPVVRSAMTARTAKIQADLDAAQMARTEAEQIKQSHAAEMAKSQANAGKILDDARQEAAVMRAELTARAEADIAEMRRRADADIVAARRRAVGDLQSEVNEIVVGAAERVVQHNLDRDSQKQLIDNYIASIGSRQ